MHLLKLLKNLASLSRQASEFPDEHSIWTMGSFKFLTNSGENLRSEFELQVQLLKRHETAVLLLDEIQDELDQVSAKLG